MVIFEKRIAVNQDRIIQFYVHDGYSKKYTIEEYFMENDEMHKNYRLSQGDDYGFDGWINASIKAKEEMSSLSFDFDINHPLYIPLINLLKGEESLLIDDDKTYSICIKNTHPDVRSKVDCSYKELKERLDIFFKETVERILLDSSKSLKEKNDSEEEKPKQYVKHN